MHLIHGRAGLGGAAARYTRREKTGVAGRHNGGVLRGTGEGEGRGGEGRREVIEGKWEGRRG